MSYTKLANSILTSTIWMEDDHTRIVWLTLLAMSDRHGEVQASIPGLANIARVPVESCRAAIEKFLSPDPDSRTKDDDGRRIEIIDGGFFILNHSKYRNLSSDEDRKQKAATRQKRYRERLKRNVTVTSPLRQNSHADADADANSIQIHNTVAPLHVSKRERFKIPTDEELTLHSQKIGLPASEVQRFRNYYESNGWRVGKNPMKSWTHALTNWKLNWETNRKRENNGNNDNRFIVGDQPVSKAERVLTERAAREKAERQAVEDHLAAKMAGSGSDTPGCSDHGLVNGALRI